MADLTSYKTCSQACVHQETNHRLSRTLLDHIAKASELQSQLTNAEMKLAIAGVKGTTPQQFSNSDASIEIQVLTRELTEARLKVEHQRVQLAHLNRIKDSRKANPTTINIANLPRRSAGIANTQALQAVQDELKRKTADVEHLLEEADYDYNRAQRYKSHSKKLEETLREYEAVFQTYNDGLGAVKDIVRVLKFECSSMNESDGRIASMASLVERLEEIMESAPDPLRADGSQDTPHELRINAALPLREKREGLRNDLEEGEVADAQLSAGPSVHPDRLRLTMEGLQSQEEDRTVENLPVVAKKITASNLVPVSLKRRFGSSYDHTVMNEPPTKQSKTNPALVNDHRAQGNPFGAARTWTKTWPGGQQVTSIDTVQVDAKVDVDSPP